MSYTIRFERNALKALRSLPTNDARRVFAALEQLAQDPFDPRHDVKRLQGRDGYRLRVGNYRVLYLLDNGALLIVVVAVADRKEIYR